MDTHEIPEILNPAGSVCYPLFIPDDPHWRQLVLGALSQLTNPDYYRQNAFAPNDVISVCETWHEQMLVPFVQSMNDETGCATMANYHEATRASTQGIFANTDTKIQFNVGATPPQDWNVPVPSAGICTVTARVYLLSASQGAKRARLLHNDVNIAELYYGSVANAQLFTLSHVLEVQAGDYFSLEVHCVTASNSQIAPFAPKISMAVADS